MVFCSLFGFFVILTWLPYYLQNERGIAGSETGFISSLVAWISIPGALLFSSLSDKLGTFNYVPGAGRDYQHVVNYLDAEYDRCYHCAVCLWSGG